MFSSPPSRRDDLSSSFTNNNNNSILRQGIISLGWSLVNWIPVMPDNLRLELQQKCWDASDPTLLFGKNNSNAILDDASKKKKKKKNNSSTTHHSESDYQLEIPRIDIRGLFQTFNNQQTDDGTSRGAAAAANDFPHFVSNYLIQTFGTDWRERPLLLKGVLDYNHHDDDDDSSSSSKKDKHLSLKGLLELDQVIPYFEQANQPGALTPTATAPVSQIVQGMLDGKPYKIGSQLLVQEHPEWMQELTGTSETSSSTTTTTTTTTGNLLSHLFGNHFSPKDVIPGRFLPATTTVPVFVANLVKNNNNNKNNNDILLSPEPSHDDDDESSCQEDDDDDSLKRTNNRHHHITTGLHCEPIGNVAFQMEGSKEWTLVSPKYSAWLQPSLAADGRAFFASSLSSIMVGENNHATTLSQVLGQKHIPHWTAVTGPSDALWVPTWTWHRVDYRLSSLSSSRKSETEIMTQEGTSCSQADNVDGGDDTNNSLFSHSSKNHELAIGGSIFHFRPWDFLRRNPLYAVLIVPALIKELAGISTQ